MTANEQWFIRSASLICFCGRVYIAHDMKVAFWGEKCVRAINKSAFDARFHIRVVSNEES